MYERASKMIERRKIDQKQKRKKNKAIREEKQE